MTSDNRFARKHLETRGWTIVDRGATLSLRGGRRRWGLITPKGKKVAATFENLRVAKMHSMR